MLTLFPKVSYWGGGRGLRWLIHTAASPDPNPRGANYPTPRAQFHANECKEGRDANPQPQECKSHANERKEGRDANPKPQERNSTPTSVEPTHPNACARAAAHPHTPAPGPSRQPHPPPTRFDVRAPCAIAQLPKPTPPQRGPGWLDQ